MDEEQKYPEKIAEEICDIQPMPDNGFLNVLNNFRKREGKDIWIPEDQGVANLIKDIPSPENK